jgi:phospholipid-translocating ATPase
MPTKEFPADLVLLYTNDVSGTVFIRTDQLDGETDWKLRKPIATTQALVAAKKNLRVVPGAVQCNPPSKLIYEFIGVYEGDDGKKEPLDLENTMWANTVLCSGKILGLIIFTGKETRMAMNSKDAREKRGSLIWSLTYFPRFCLYL